MAIIDLNKKRETSGGYLRLCGNKEIANLGTAMHAAVISVGTQTSQKLELSYTGELPIFSGEKVNTPTKTLEVLRQNPNGVIIFNGYVKGKNGKKQEVDLIIFYTDILYISEIKDGNALDTKKSPAEIDGIENAMNFYKSKNYNTSGSLVLMHMENNNHSIKDMRAKKYVISGQDMCKKFSFDFSKFSNFQKKESSSNEKIILDEMFKILTNSGRL